MKMLEVSDFSVSKRGKKLVSSVDFALEKSKLVALLGPNGSEKTTLIRGICGLNAHEGKCFFGGVDSKTLSSREISRIISYIPQRSGINFSISVLEFVLMGFAPKMSIFADYSPIQRDLAREALGSVDMLSRENDDFTRLSEGEKQLVILARAIMQNSDIMIFDEPDSALDFCNRHRILTQIREIISEDKLGILCLHDANFALAYCDYALILREGQLVSKLDIKNSTNEIIENELKKVYGDVKIADIDGTKIMLRR